MTPAEERKYWDAVAKDRDRIAAEVYSDLDLEECLAAVETGIAGAPAEGYVLEIGCGVGRLTIPLAERHPYWQFIGADISPEMIREARRRVRGILYMTIRGRNLAMFEDSFFVAAYSMTTLQHLPREAQREYVHEVYRVLKPGGVFRFQFVEEGAEGPLSHPVPYPEMAAWCEQAGFDAAGNLYVGFNPVSTQHGLVRPQWGWVTAEKPA